MKGTKDYLRRLKSNNLIIYKLTLQISTQLSALSNVLSISNLNLMQGRADQYFIGGGGENKFWAP